MLQAQGIEPDSAAMIVASNSKKIKYIPIKQITKIPNIYIFIVKEPN
jgi:hypothetical protein